MSSRDLSLLRRALRYERDTGEVSASFFLYVCVCVRACVLLASKPLLLIPHFFPFSYQTTFFF